MWDHTVQELNSAWRADGKNVCTFQDNFGCVFFDVSCVFSRHSAMAGDKIDPC